MTIYIFGKDDLIAVPFLYAKSFSSLGDVVRYTHPTYQSFFSEYGLHIPTDYNGVPYREFISDRLHILPPGVKRYKIAHSYIYVTPSGKLWSIFFSHDKTTDEPTQIESFIHNKNNGWWIHTNETGTTSFEHDLLLGYLTTDPSIEEIEAFYFEHFVGAKLTWLKISEIVDQCNLLYPPKTEPESDKEKPEKET